MVDVQWNVKSLDVRQYLREHLYVANPWSAASIMPSRLGVKVISSSRSGVGEDIILILNLIALSHPWVKGQPVLLSVDLNK